MNADEHRLENRQGAKSAKAWTAEQWEAFWRRVGLVDASGHYIDDPGQQVLLPVRLNLAGGVSAFDPLVQPRPRR